MSYYLVWLSIYINYILYLWFRPVSQTKWLEIYVSDPYGWSPMSQTPMAGTLCLRPLWFETYVSDTYGWRPMFQDTYVSETYGWRPMSQTPMAGDLCLGHIWLETYVSDPYGWRPMSQTPMRLSQS